MQVTESASRRFGQIGTVPCMEMYMEIDGIEVYTCSDCESEEATQGCFCYPEGGFCLRCLLRNHKHPDEDGGR